MPASVIMAVGTAIWSTSPVNTLYLVLILTGAVSSHISVNAFNEYFDFKSGLEYKTVRNTFSGGSGTLPEHPDLANQALFTALTAFAITCLTGLFLLLAYLSIIAGIYSTCLPVTSLLGLGTIILAAPAAVGAYRYCDDIERLKPYMALNVAITVITPALVAIGALVG